MHAFRLRGRCYMSNHVNFHQEYEHHFFTGPVTLLYYSGHRDDCPKGCPRRVAQ